ncbi:hypothetical protein EXIGLDRAFT_724350 [Exidia glandulosa HHB12029]|uniref:Uncharacterized protein n=1 Tax=Exidia glandulosa HHB12029 TaxID=1314781 RepID=A0A165EFX6_EXIGL|nr:hypothetical protein EXIGLDRAFT_724350 [Exidia glandulosa HHB12029]
MSNEPDSEYVDQAIAVLKDTLIAPSDAATQIASLCAAQVASGGSASEPGDTPGLGDFLWFFWTALFDAVENDDALHSRAVEILAQLSALAGCGPDGDAEWRVWGEPFAWRGLPLFGPVAREEYNGPRVRLNQRPIWSSDLTPEDYVSLCLPSPPSPDDARATAFYLAARRWVRYNAFCALLTGWPNSFFNGLNFALWAMRDALEYAHNSAYYTSNQSLGPRDLAIECAAAWVQHAGGRMYVSREIMGPKGNPDWPDNMGVPGKGGDLWTGVDGYDPARWQLWKKGFEAVVADDSTVERVRRIAKAAVEAMTLAEG